MATRKKKNNIGAFGHPIYGKGFAKYGEMRPNGSSEIPNDLEEAADNHIRKVVDIAGHPGWDWETQDITEAFIAGAEWQKEQYHFFNEAWADDMQYQLNRNYENGKQAMKEQMMKEAVEGVLVATAIGHLRIEAETDGKNGMKHGDKVRVIIVKED